MDAYCSWDDTIAPPSATQGVSVISVICLSGHRAIEILDLMTPAKDIRQQSANILHVGYQKQGETISEEVMLSLFRAPKPYLGRMLMGAFNYNSAPIEQNTKNEYFQVLGPAHISAVQ